MSSGHDSEHNVGKEVGKDEGGYLHRRQASKPFQSCSTFGFFLLVLLLYWLLYPLFHLLLSCKG